MRLPTVEWHHDDIETGDRIIELRFPKPWLQATTSPNLSIAKLLVEQALKLIIGERFAYEDRENMDTWVRDLVESAIGGPPFAIGERVRHPDGRLVEIVSGQYWGNHGLSNFWRWREVLPDGSLGQEEQGYGWRRRA